MRCFSQMMMVAGLLLVSGPALAKKKKPAEEAPPEPVVEEVKPQTPGDKNSEKFAATLISTEISGFSPLNAGSGARFIYDTLRFAPDNSWSAQGYVELMGERMECKEGGTWEMEPAASAIEATMVWNVVTTNCINQEPGPRRYLVTLEGGSIRVAYR